MSVNVRTYPKAFTIDASNFDNDLYNLLDKLLPAKVEENYCRPSVKGTQTASAYFLEIKLPGVTEKNLELHFDNSTLTIQSMPDEDRDENPKGRVISFSTGNKRDANPMENKVKPFRKKYRLPKDADPHGITALFCDGVLSVEIGKKLDLS
jgi:HSP20 family protein